MTDEKLLIKLKTKLLITRDSKKWFISTYLPNESYFTIINQINSNSSLQDITKEAIEKYLAE